MHTPRDYQLHAVESIPAYFAKKSGNPLICMPTGTGKSLVIAEAIKYIFRWPGQRVVVATHVKELINQNYDELMQQWPQAPAGIYSSGLKRKDVHLPILFVGIASVAKRAEMLGRVDIFFIDEAHLLSPSETTTYQKVIALLLKINPLMKVIGLTATKWRLGHGEIAGGEGNLFTDIAIDMTTMQGFNWFIDQGYLVPLIPKKPKALLDISGVHMQGGEFKQAELQLAVDKDVITERALREAMELGAGRNRWLIFAAGVEHAIHIADMLTALGVECRAVHSKMGDEERDKNLRDHKAGLYPAIVNNNVLTTGYNDPKIDFIIMLRPTASTVLWVQMLGRGTRPDYIWEGFDMNTRDGRLASIAASDKQNCLVADFAGNTKRLGPVNDPVVPRKKGSGGGGEAPIKLCMSCGVWNHASLRHCCACGAEFVFAVKIKETADSAQLIKQDIPVVETFAVDQITYVKHVKRETGVASVKVSYFCGLRAFTDWVPVEAVGSAHGIAKRWWRERKAPLELPRTVDETLLIIDRLPPSTHIRVWTNKKYPEIIAHCFDGTCFGTTPPPAAGNQVLIQVPEVALAAPQPWNEATYTGTAPAKYDIMDDDIPF